MSNLTDELRSAYQSWHDTLGANVQTWIDLFADDIELRSIGDGTTGMEFSAPRSGKEAAVKYFVDLQRDWEMVFYQADEFIADGDRVVMLGRCAYRFRPTGKTAESPIMHVMRFRDGKIAELREFYDTARALAATTAG